MKLVNKLLVSSAIICISLCACQKDYSPDDNTTPPTTGDSNYLDKIYWIDVVGAVEDTFKVFTYQYDNERRVTTFKRYNYSSQVYELAARFDYYYQGTERRPYKMIRTDSTWMSPTTDTLLTIFTYNALGLRLKDSVSFLRPGSISTSSISYSYAPGKIYGIERDATSITGYDTATIDGNGNVLSFKSEWSNGNQTVFGNYTYDNHPSPFAKLSNHISLPIFPAGETFIWEHRAYNNRLVARETSTGGLDFDQDFTGQYVYKPNGYPSYILSPDIFSPGEAEKIVFVYKEL